MKGKVYFCPLKFRVIYILTLYITKLLFWPFMLYLFIYISLLHIKILILAIIMFDSVFCFAIYISKFSFSRRAQINGQNKNCKT